MTTKNLKSEWQKQNIGIKDFSVKNKRAEEEIKQR